MPPKKSATTPKPQASKAAPRMPRRLPTSYSNAPLQARRGWKGAPLPFNDIDGALAWGFGNEKLEDAQDMAAGWQASSDAYQASDATHRARTRAAETELLNFPKHGPKGKYVTRRERQEPAGAGAPGAPVIIAEAARVRGRAQSVSAKARAPPARTASAEPAAPAGPKKEPPAGPKEPPPAPPPAGPKKEPDPESGRPSLVKTGETPAAALSRRAAEKVEEASAKEEQFREEKQEIDRALVVLRRGKRFIPDEMKRKEKWYSEAALKKLTDERIAAERDAAKALLANVGVSQRNKVKGKK